VASETPDFEALRDAFRAVGQEHVFDFYDRLGESERGELLAQAARLAPTLEAWAAERTRAVEALSSESQPTLAPAPAIALPEFGGDARRIEEARQRGEALLAEGRVAVFVVAGGQGTRLGFPRPKGAYPIGPIGSRSLFEIQAQKIRGLRRRTGRSVPWYVMTSPATDADTRAFFEEMGHFGLPAEDVRLFSQDMVPASGLDGRMILEAPHRIAESPNGHGGALLALCDSGALDAMEARGIDRIFYYQVDNPLVRIADPVFLGFHELEEAEMSCKVIRKTDPMEKVGVVALRDGRPGIVEYTELREPERSLRDDEGRLVFWAGSIAIHVLDTAFVRRVRNAAERCLPYHASAKTIPTVDPSGRTVAPSEPNGYKLERFVFDALPEARRVCVLEVRPEEDFSPIKNDEGKDSPETARRDLVARYRAWLTKAGIDVPEDVSAIEIDHAHIDSAEEAAASGLTSIEEAGDVIRVATGMDA
jgi:UDP-N-acetylglucosamine/UDP-N-acetylgalactosamine diphosphorylase